jgi:repressor of nif and glnA expression
MMTSGQRELLEALAGGPRTARQLAEGGYGTTGTRSRLRRLEDRDLVRRLGDVPYRWEITQAGRDAIAR